VGSKFHLFAIWRLNSLYSIMPLPIPWGQKYNMLHDEISGEAIVHRQCSLRDLIGAAAPMVTARRVHGESLNIAHLFVPFQFA
jgi:hypothetical protein